MCNKVWDTGVWPEDWCESVFVPLHKKGPTTRCENYRTISLISHASKILLQIILARLRPFLDRQIPQEQAGFVKGKGAREQILNIRQMIEKSREFQIPMVVCFLDYHKAFDCVNWRHLWNILAEMGTPGHLVILIKNLYESNSARIRLDNLYSTSFKVERGVRQGCILSPALFNIYGEYIMRKALEDWNGGIVIAGKKISNLRYADDTTLVAANEEEMTALLRRVEMESLKLDLKINRQKTKIMVIDRSNSIQRIAPPDGIELVDGYVYLGSYINNQGNCSEEIRRRIGMAKSAVSRLTKIWRDRSISKRVKMELMRALVFSIFLYGAETWTLRATDRRKIDAFEMWCWRRMLRIPWTARRTNISILRELVVRTRLSSICLQRALQFFGHIARRDGNSLERLIVTGNVEGRRPRGRSPTRWADQIRVAIGTSFCGAIRRAEDREQWKELVVRVTEGHDPQ